MGRSNKAQYGLKFFYTHKIKLAPRYFSGVGNQACLALVLIRLTLSLIVEPDCSGLLDISGLGVIIELFAQK